MTTIKLKNGSGAPTAGDLAQGEPALDLTNKRLYTEDSGGTVIEVGTNPTSVTTGDITATGTATFAGLTTTADVSFGDNDKATFGAGSDLQIYHDGSNSYVQDAGTGNLFLQGTELQLRANNSMRYLTAVQAAEVKLYHNNSEKLATSSSGIDVTGTVTADGLTVSTSGTNAEAYFDNGTQSYRLLNRSSDNAFSIFDNTASAFRLTTASNGDISFYEDTGTTAKLFWDASAESLGIGTSSPDTQLTLYKASTNVDVNYAKMRMDSWGGSTGKLKSIAWDDNGSPVAAIGAEYDGAKTNIHFHSQYNGGFKGTSDRTMSIMGNGNVGIGTSSPSATLEVDGVTNSTYLIVGGDDSSNGRALTFTSSASAAFNGAVHTINAPSTQGAIALATGSTERMRLDASGNVGIGRTNPSSYVTDATSLYVKGQIRVDGISNTAALPALTLNDTNSGIFAPAANTISISTAAAERMRIDASGNLLVGTTSTTDSAKFSVLSSGTAASFRTTPTTTISLITFRNGNGLVGSISTNGSATSYNTSSDQRLKDNIVDAPSASDDIDAIQVRSFDWKADGSHQKYGMVAQELQSVAPEAVSQGETEEDMMGVDYSKLVPMMMKEIQSLRARVAQLEGVN